MIVDDNLTDIVAERIDAGIRFGDIVEKDMIAVRIGPDIRMAVVGAPSYFAEHPVPQTPRELSGHRCINYRHIKTGGLYAWDFEEKGRPFEVRVEGPLVFNNSDLIREAALAGQGLAYVYEDEVAAEIEAGTSDPDSRAVVPDFSRLLSLSSEPASVATGPFGFDRRTARQIIGPEIVSGPSHRTLLVFDLASNRIDFRLMVDPGQFIGLHLPGPWLPFARRPSRLTS